MKLKRLTVAVLCLSTLIAATVYGVLATRSTANAGLALAELQVSKMTCGSCVATITEALEKVSGVETVDISVTTGIGKVAFDPSRVDATSLAETVTATGFPASLKQLLTTEQYQALQTEEAKLAADYVARIGEQLIARKDFDKQVDNFLAASGASNRPEARPQAMMQTWQKLMQRTLLLQDAEKNQVVVQPGEVDLQIDQMRKRMPNLDNYITARYGSAEKFHQQMKEDMVINRNIDQFVLGQLTDRKQRQTAYNRWFQGLTDNATIVIYDAQLKQSASSSGGCCGGAGGGCG